MEQIKKGIPNERINRVSSKNFHDLKNKTDSYSVCMSILWSFGNDRCGYLYSWDIEERKKALHYAVVYGDYSLLTEYGVNISLTWKTIKERRIEIKDKLRQTHIKQLWENMERIQHLERRESLENIRDLENLDNLEVINTNYKNLKIETPINETVIYCDPPYRGTAEYKVQKERFNYKELDKRFRELPCPAYMSEENPHTIVLTMTKDRTMSWNWGGSKVYEVLYYNWITTEKKQEILQADLFT